jgi:hypothetical protein
VNEIVHYERIALVTQVRSLAATHFSLTQIGRGLRYFSPSPSFSPFSNLVLASIFYVKRSPIHSLVKSNTIVNRLQNGKSSERLDTPRIAPLRMPQVYAQYYFPSLTYLLKLLGDEMWTFGDFGDVCPMCGHEKCWCGSCAEELDDEDKITLERTKSNKLKKRARVLVAF